MNPRKPSRTVGHRSKSDKLPRKSPKGKLADHPAFQELDRLLKSGQLDPDRTAAFLKSNPIKEPAPMTTPAEPKSKMLNIRLTPELHKCLKLYAVDQGLSMQAAFSKILEEEVQRHLKAGTIPGRAPTA